MENKLPKYPVKKDKEDARDYKFKAVRYAAESDLPSEVDLSGKCSPVAHQGSLGACTGFGIVKGFREYLLNRFGRPYTPLSPLFLYYKEREMEGTISEDAGAYIRDGMQVLQQIGVCPEADDPYDISKFTQPPSAQALQNAAAYKIMEYHRVDTYGLLKHALAEGLPVVIGIEVYESFETMDVSLSGMIPVPKPGEKFLGGHCMSAFGYKTFSDGVERVKVRNSWGENWGQFGYCWIPKEFFDAGHVMDMWTGTSQYTADTVTLEQALQLFVSRGIFDSPDFWTSFLAQQKAGTLTNDECKYVGLGFRKIAADMMNRG